MRRGEPEGLGSERVQVGCSMILPSVDAKIVDAQIIGEDEDDIGRRRLARRPRRTGSGKKHRARDRDDHRALG